MTTTNIDVYDYSNQILGLVFFNPTDRGPEAYEEARRVKSGLVAAGCDVRVKRWTTNAKLLNLISDGLKSVDKYSGLVVFIMAHGAAGTLQTNDGDRRMVLNFVIFQITRELPDNIPAVRVISY